MENISDIDNLIKKYDNELELSSFVKRQIKDGIIAHNIGSKLLFEVANKQRRNTFKKIKPEDVKSIFQGSIKPLGCQGLYHKFDSETGILKDFVTSRNKVNKVFKTSSVYSGKIEDTNEFIRQLLNIAYISGGNLKLGVPEKGYHVLIRLKDGLIYHISINKKYSDVLRWFIYTYLDYHLYMCDLRIETDDKLNALKKLINRSSKNKELYLHLKEFFDNTDFLYGVLAHLNTERKVEIFLLMLEKNEGVCAHMPMNSIIGYMSEAHVLFGFSDNFKPKFIKDTVQKYLQDDITRKLYEKLEKIFKYKENIENIIILLKTKENMELMVKFLETGVKNIDKIHYKVAEIIRNEKKRK